jgi:MFS family permease
VNIAAALAGSRARIRNVETFSSLQANPNFRLYWIGSFVSNFGTWMQSVAQGWLVYQLTGSTFMLGVVGFAQSIPFLFLALFGGVLADRFERRRLMVWTQTGLMLLAFLLAGLTLAGVVTVWHVLAIALANGVVNAFNVPVRQSIISDLVPKEHLPNAIAVNSSQVQLSRFLGPALAGLMLALTNAGWCFFLNAVSFLAVIWTLIVMDVPPLPPRAPQSPLRSILEGLAYVRGHPTISALLVMAAIPSLFALPYQQMLPAFAESVLDAGPSGLGLMQSAAGLGALVGALAVASLAGRRSGWLMLAAVVVLGCGLIAFSASTMLWLSLPLLFVTGGASMTYNTLNQGFLQRRVSDEMRGRVLSLLTMTMFGLQPFGSVELGTLASFVGPQLALGFGGAVCVVAALFALSRWPTLRALR